MRKYRKDLKMNITIKKANGSLTQFKAEVCAPQDMEILPEMIELIKYIISDGSKPEAVPIPEKTPDMANIVKVKPVDPMERSIVRERLPNDVVDLSEMKLVREESNGELRMRCPHCGQQTFAIVTVAGLPEDVCYVAAMNYETNKYHVSKAILEKETISGFKETIMEIISKPENVINYSADIIRNNPDINLPITEESIVNCFCPCCGHEEEIIKWVNAFYNPRSEEVADRCIICGGDELTAKIDESHDKENPLYTCEQCGNTIGTTPKSYIDIKIKPKGRKKKSND